MNIVTLTTDFGDAGPYVGAMKGKILSESSQTSIVDITHLIPPQNILAAQITLADVADYFPSKTVHLCVVDPGVGSARASLIVATPNYFFVGPDNGIFAFTRNQPEKKIFQIRRDLFPSGMGQTFEGRDLFAPVAARLASGISPERLGTAVDKMVELAPPSVVHQEKKLQGEVIFVDRFGNLVTNIIRSDAKGRSARTQIADTDLGPVLGFYSEVPPGALLALWNSSDRLEIAARNGSAQERLGGTQGTPISLVWT